LVFSVIVLLLKDAFDLVEEIGNQFFGGGERIGPSFVGMTSRPWGQQVAMKALPKMVDAMKAQGYQLKLQ
jgi:hypothetical protein